MHAAPDAGAGVASGAGAADPVLAALADLDPVRVAWWAEGSVAGARERAREPPASDGPFFVLQGAPLLAPRGDAADPDWAALLASIGGDGTPSGGDGAGAAAAVAATARVRAWATPCAAAAARAQTALTARLDGLDAAIADAAASLAAGRDAAAAAADAARALAEARGALAALEPRLAKAREAAAGLEQQWRRRA